MTRKQTGFTIVELLIATLIFSVIIMVITAAVIRFSKQYYHGVIANATQDTARSVMDDLTRSIQFNSGKVETVGNGYCVGSTKRYSVKLNQQVTSGTLGADQGRHALVVDSNSSCASTGAINLTPTTGLPGGSNARELLSERMRLAQFSINPIDPANTTYVVQLKIAYGDDDLLVCNGHAITSDNLRTSATCQKTLACASNAGAEYCAVAQLTTVIKKRIN